MVLNSPHNEFLKQANEKFLIGDAIDDQELRALLQFYNEMEAGLDFLGDRFYYQWNEIRRRRDLLEDFRRARKRG